MRLEAYRVGRVHQSKCLRANFYEALSIANLGGQSSMDAALKNLSGEAKVIELLSLQT